MWWDVAIVHAQCLLFFLMSPLWWRSFSLRCYTRVHFIWSSAFTILFCMVCDVPTALVSTKLSYTWNDPFNKKIIHIFVLLFKMSWYEITKKVGVLTEGTSRTSVRNKKIDASRNRLFRVAIMSCACLLMNTAATVSLSVVLENWSVSSEQWLTCTTETFLTRNWANYGFYEGDRYFLFYFVTERYLSVTVLTNAASSVVPALQGTNGVMTSPRKQQTKEEDCWKKFARRRGPLVCSLNHGPIQLLLENQYCETKCSCPFCLVPRHVIGTQNSNLVVNSILNRYATIW